MLSPSIGVWWPEQDIILSPSAKEIPTDSSSIVRYPARRERDCGRGMFGQDGGLRERSAIRNIMPADLELLKPRRETGWGPDCMQDIP